MDGEVAKETGSRTVVDLEALGRGVSEVMHVANILDDAIDNYREKDIPALCDQLIKRAEELKLLARSMGL